MPVRDPCQPALPIRTSIAAVLVTGRVGITGLVDDTVGLERVETLVAPPAIRAIPALRTRDAVEQVRLRKIDCQIRIIALPTKGALDRRGTAEGDTRTASALIDNRRNEVPSPHIAQVVACGRRCGGDGSGFPVGRCRRFPFLEGRCARGRDRPQAQALFAVRQLGYARRPGDPGFARLRDRTLQCCGIHSF